MFRVSDKFRVPLAIMDDWSIEAILDEVEANMWLFDHDNPPPPKNPSGPGGMGKLASM